MTMLMLGLYFMGEAFLREARRCSVMSDFSAFRARVADTSEGEAILNLGGERESDTFDDLVGKSLSAVRSNPLPGILLIVLATVALMLDARRNDRIGHHSGHRGEDSNKPME